MKTVNTKFDPRGLLAKVRPIDKPGNTAVNAQGSQAMASSRPDDVPMDENDAKHEHHKKMAAKAPTHASRKLHKKLAQHFKEKLEAAHIQEVGEKDDDK